MVAIYKIFALSLAVQAEYGVESYVEKHKTVLHIFKFSFTRDGYIVLLVECFVRIAFDGMGGVKRGLGRVALISWFVAGVVLVRRISLYNGIGR